MFTETDYDKLRQIMTRNPEDGALIQKLLDSHEETVRTISHEIRNPLTLIYSTLPFLEAECPELKKARHWAALKEDTEYMKQLLEELSSYNNGGALSISSFDFGTFIKQLSVSFAASLADHPIEFTSYAAPNLPYIEGDRIKLREVLLNLLRNASESISDTDATATAGSFSGTIRLHASYEHESNQILVEIRDSGCGIDAADLHNIFTPFVTHKRGGTGLGLAIAKRIIESHQGHISVQSEPGLGSTFAIRLPVKQHP